MKVFRHSLIFGLSYALDIAGKNNLSHSKSTAYLSAGLGRALGFNGCDALALYYAALLHDIGISNEYVLNEHCSIGAEMLKKLPLPEEIPGYVLYHHEYRDGTGLYGLSGDETPLASQIICFSSTFDDMFGKNSCCFNLNLFTEAQAWIAANEDIFSPDVVSAFRELMKRESFLLDYFNFEIKYTLSGKVAADDGVCYDYGDVLKFAGCFADIIDRRSPFTFRHSRGIADLARLSAARLGYDAETQDKMYIAGLLHDIGKLHVPADILHKNGKLTPEERFEINKHTYYTRKILEQIQGFEDIVDCAANHHEKMDGSGYPNRLAGEQMGELEKAMAVCDVFQALTEERPYRNSLPPEKVWGIIDGMAERRHLDQTVVSKLKGTFNSL